MIHPPTDIFQSLRNLSNFRVRAHGIFSDVFRDRGDILPK